MRRIYPQLPDEWDCETTGYLVESDDPGDLGEDMLEVLLANGILIEAGWCPEGDPSGRYVISVTHGLDHLVSPIDTDDADAAIRDVESFVDQFRKLPVVFADSENECTQLDTTYRMVSG